MREDLEVGILVPETIEVRREPWSRSDKPYKRTMVRERVGHDK